MADLPIPELVENQRRSIAMLAPGVPALNREQALELLEQLKVALIEVRRLRANTSGVVALPARTPDTLGRWTFPTTKRRSSAFSVTSRSSKRRLPKRTYLRAEMKGSPETIAELVERLADRGYVKRVRAGFSEEPMAVYAYRLTEQGERALSHTE